MLAVAVVPRGSNINPGNFQNIVAQGQPPANAPMGQRAGQFGFQGGQIGNLGAIPNPDGLAKAADLENTTRFLRQQAQQELNKQQDGTSNDIFNYAGALDQAKELVLNPEGRVNKALLARARNEGPSVTYHLNARLSVPSRDDDQVLEVTRIDLAPEYFYKAVP